jgi:DNA/RNA endonuclease YhcR with UshA esterase domain
MRLTQLTLSVSALVLAANAATAPEPAYNPLTVVSVLGTVTSVRQAAPDSSLPGLHLTLQAKSGTFDVYVGPSDFLKFLKVGFKTGDRVEIVGSKVKFENADVILTRQVDDGFALVTLRDPSGIADWKSWGKEIDPALAQ